MRYIVILFGLILFLMAASLSAARQPPARSPWLEFTRLQPGQQAVYCRLRLATGAVACSDEAGGGLAGKRAWSPNGAWGAFMAFQDDEWQLYRRSLNGRRVENLTQNIGISGVSFPSWSPDGKWLIFAAQRGSSLSDIYRMPAEGGRTDRLTYDYGNEWQPVWSPDGAWIAFVSSPGGAESNLYLMRPDGSDLKPVLETLQYAARPSWSPDGQWILFESNCYDLLTFARGLARTPCQHADFELYLIHPDGTHLTRITSAQSDDYSAAWSPDGEWIAFTSRSFLGGVDNVPSIYVIHPDGSGRHRLTFPNAGDLYPVWSPIVDLRWHGWVVLALGIGLLALSFYRWT